MKTLIYIVLYLGAIVSANFIVGQYGPEASIPTAFVFIGLDLTTRDQLHEAFKKGHLKTKLFLLILCGSVLSYLLNDSLKNIAIASCVAFGSAATIDSIIYTVLEKYPRHIRVNVSNVFSSIVDSYLFITLAFGTDWTIISKQSAVKILGGLLWMVVFVYADKIILRYWGKEVEPSSC